MDVQTPETPAEGILSQSSPNAFFDEVVEIAQGGGEAPASAMEAASFVSVYNTFIFKYQSF